MAILSRVKPSTPAYDQSRACGLLKVAFISHTSILGGAERSLLQLVAGLQAKGVDCLVFLPSAGPLELALSRVGVRHAIVKYSRWSNPVHKVRRNLNNILGPFGWQEY